MKIAFHTNQLSLRGTEVALYDYALHNVTLLGNESIIITKNPNVWKYSHPLAILKFQEKFKVFFYNEITEIEQILKDNNVDMFYTMKAGFNDGVMSKNIKTVVHAVFQHCEPHGAVYAYISKWLGDKYKKPYVPYMVTLPNIDSDLRAELNIPKDAIVFGRHGGLETFDIQYVHETVKQFTKLNKNVYFLFLNTNKFSDDSYKNIIYLDGTDNLEYKTRFINTCDAMLHARVKGESFGLAIGEFSIRNKPIITCKKGTDLAHLAILNGKGFFYGDKTELMNILNNFKVDKTIDWNCYCQYEPNKVMEIFKNTFLK